ncbi:MAG: pyridoxal-phosphate dependent enzyme [Caldilineaceae bacterium]
MSVPTLDTIRSTRERIAPYIVETPVWHWRNRDIVQAMDAETEIFLKLELFQHTGSFKPRGALNNIMALDADARARGVTAISAGNHAIAVAYAASILGTTAKVVMPQSANPARVQICRDYGAESSCWRRSTPRLSGCGPSKRAKAVISCTPVRKGR